MRGVHLKEKGLPVAVGDVPSAITRFGCVLQYDAESDVSAMAALDTWSRNLKCVVCVTCTPGICKYVNRSKFWDLGF